MRPPPRLCVRCGRRPREGETFLCRACHDDPALHQELQVIERDARDWESQRRLAIETYGWAGGWGRP